MDWRNNDGCARDDWQLVRNWGQGPAVDVPRITLSTVVERTAARHPDATALVHGSTRLTYRELDQAANQLAHRLRELGVGPEVGVGVCVRRTPFMVVALLGVLKAGGYYVPLDAGLPSERIALMLADADARACVVDADTARQLPSGPWQVVADTPDDSALPHPPVPTASDPEHLAYVLYTSGSTGRPKGVCVEHRSVVDFVLNNADFYGVGPDDRMLAFASLGFDVSVAEIYTALAVGAALVIADEDDKLSIDRLQHLLRRERVTVAEVPQTVLGLLDPEELPDLRLVPLGGEAPNPRVTARWVRAGIRVINAYGPTETTVTATMMDCPPRELPSVPIGRPIPNRRLYVLDAHGEPLPPGASGELWVAGVGVARGYLNQPELTAQRFLPDRFSDVPGERMYRTGDRVRWLPDGTLEFLGRVDAQLNLRGFRIEPGEVENRLLAHPGVANAAVTVAADQLVGYIVAVDDPPGPAELTAWCREQLPPHMVPSTFVTVDALPLTMTGKVDRSALPAPVFTSAAEAAEPRTPTEKRLLALWQEVLPAGPIGVHDRFVERGGNSLLAMRLLARIRRVFGVELPPAGLLRGGSIAAQAADIDVAVPAESHALPLPLRRGCPQEPVPLSYAQRQLWFVDQLGTARGAFNLPVALRLRGAVDPDTLSRALSDVVAAHDVLRTSFPTVDGEPRVRLDSTVPVKLRHTDLRHVPESQREAVLKELVDTEANAPFRLASGPLWRARLVRTGEADWALLFVIHHAIADGWSLSLFLHELGHRYDRHLTGLALELAAPEVGYGDFAAWQQAQLREERHQRRIEFWTHTLAGAPPVLDLPADRPRPSVQTYRAGRLAAQVSAELVGPLRELAARHDVTPFVPLLTVFTVLLGRLAGVEDVVVACPVAGRPEPELEQVIGLFVNTVPLRTDLSGAPTVEQLLTRVGAGVIDAFAHASVPFELIVEAVRPPRTANRQPLAQVGFNLLNYPPEQLSLSGVDVTPMSVEPPGSLLDLTLYVREHDAEMMFELVYNRDLFDDDRMQAMLRQYVDLLGQAVATPHRPITDLSLRSAGDVDRLPDPAQPLTGTCGPTAVARFRGHAQQTPNRVAVTGPDGSLTYGQLDRGSDQLAAALAAAGVGLGDIVAVHAVRAPRLVVALLGVFKLGAVVALLDATHPPARLTSMLRAVEPAAWLTVDDTEVPAELLAYLDGCPQIQRLAVATALHEPPPRGGHQRQRGVPPGGVPRLDDPAHALFTSGSTGTPKAVLATHRPLAHFIDWYAQRLNLGPNDQFALTSGVAHDPVLRDLLVPLSVGATVHVPPPDVHRAPDRLLRWLHEARITVLHTTPQLGRLLAGSAAQPSPGAVPIQLPALRLIATSGDTLLATDVAGLAGLAPAAQVVAFYGATETPQAMAWQPAADADGRVRVPIGRGIDDVQLLIHTASGDLAGVGELGEIVVRTPHLAMGYINDPALTAQRFTEPAPGDRRYRTGDLGRYLPDGRVEFTGRRDGQVKIRGFRVELAEVRAALEAHPDVGQAVVTVAEDSDVGDRELAAYVVPAPGRAPQVEELTRHVHSLLPHYAAPAGILVMDRLPLGANGKVDLSALPLVQRRRVRAPAYRPPRSPIEQSIATVWREVLGLTAVGLDDNFFDLGGTSMRLVEVQIRLQNSVGRPLSVVDLYQYPTVRLLAAYLSGDAATGTTNDRTARRVETRLASRARRHRYTPRNNGREDSL